MTILFDEAFMRKLEQLSLAVRRVRSGHFKGEQRSLRRGQSVEFADYRNYVRGDDLRALDWNIYARLERPFIKLFEEEVDQTVHILLDASASMDWPRDDSGDNSIHKWTYARRLAASLGYIALANSDRLTVTSLNAGESAVWGPERRRQQVHTLLQFLNNVASRTHFDFNTGLTRYAQQQKRRGLLIFISDFLATEDYQIGLRALQGRGHELVVLHLLAPDEIDPVLSGDFQLQDVESERQQELTINATMRRLYQEKFHAWQGELAAYCSRRDIPYALVSTAQPFEEIILQYLRRRGIVR